MYPGGAGFRPISETCGGRKDVGPHEIPANGGSATCVHCGALVYNNVSPLTPPVATVTEVKPMPEPEPSPVKRVYQEVGLIDGLLDRRRMPDPTQLVDFLTNADFAKGFQAGIDVALDQLIPALKRVALLPPLTGMPGSCPRGEVDKIIGRVPLKRTAKGWE